MSTILFVSASVYARSIQTVKRTELLSKVCVALSLTYLLFDFDISFTTESITVSQKQR